MAIFSYETGDEVVVFTDAAKCSMDGTVRDISSKVTTAKKAPVAVAFKGPTYGSEIAQAICDLADKVGVPAMLEGLQPMIDANLDVLGHELFTGANYLTFLVAVCDPASGAAFHLCFRTDFRGARPHDSLLCEMPIDFSLVCVDSKPNEVFRPEWNTFIGPNLADEDFEAIPLRNPAMPWVEYLREVGAQVIDMMRAKPRSVAAFVREEPRSTVGGWIDMTIVDRDGARTERLKTWDDKVGENIPVAT